MATNWDSEMQDKFDKLQAALTHEFRTQFRVMGAGLEERLEQRLRDNLSKDLIVQLKAMGAGLEERLERRFRDNLSKDLTVQLKAMGAELEERLEQRLRDNLSKDRTVQLKAMGAELEERLEQRLDARLSHRLNVQAEQLREIVKTAADNYGGVLDSIKSDLADFRSDWRKEAEDTRRILTNHGGRLEAIEKTLSGS